MSFSYGLRMLRLVPAAVRVSVAGGAAYGSVQAGMWSPRTKDSREKLDQLQREIHYPTASGKVHKSYTCACGISTEFGHFLLFTSKIRVVCDVRVCFSITFCLLFVVSEALQLDVMSFTINKDSLSKVPRCFIRSSCLVAKTCHSTDLALI